MKVSAMFIYKVEKESKTSPTLILYKVRNLDLYGWKRLKQGASQASVGLLIGEYGGGILVQYANAADVVKLSGIEILPAIE
jgi:hypothetical protein